MGNVSASIARTQMKDSGQNDGNTEMELECLAFTLSPPEEEESREVDRPFEYVVHGQGTWRGRPAEDVIERRRQNMDMENLLKGDEQNETPSVQLSESNDWLAEANLHQMHQMYNVLSNRHQYQETASQCSQDIEDSHLIGASGGGTVERKEDESALCSSFSSTAAVAGSFQSQLVEFKQNTKTCQSSQVSVYGENASLFSEIGAKCETTAAKAYPGYMHRYTPTSDSSQNVQHLEGTILGVQRSQNTGDAYSKKNQNTFSEQIYTNCFTDVQIVDSADACATQSCDSVKGTCYTAPQNKETGKHTETISNTPQREDDLKYNSSSQIALFGSTPSNEFNSVAANCGDASSIQLQTKLTAESHTSFKVSMEDEFARPNLKPTLDLKVTDLTQRHSQDNEENPFVNCEPQTKLINPDSEDSDKLLNPIFLSASETPPMNPGLYSFSSGAATMGQVSLQTNGSLENVQFQSNETQNESDLSSLDLNVATMGQLSVHNSRADNHQSIADNTFFIKNNALILNSKRPAVGQSGFQRSNVAESPHSHGYIRPPVKHNSSISAPKFLNKRMILPGQNNNNTLSSPEQEYQDQNGTQYTNKSNQCDDESVNETIEFSTQNNKPVYVSQSCRLDAQLIWPKWEESPSDENKSIGSDLLRRTMRLGTKSNSMQNSCATKVNAKRDSMQNDGPLKLSSNRGTIPTERLDQKTRGETDCLPFTATAHDTPFGSPVTTSSNAAQKDDAPKCTPPQGRGVKTQASSCVDDRINNNKTNSRVETDDNRTEEGASANHDNQGQQCGEKYPDVSADVTRKGSSKRKQGGNHQRLDWKRPAANQMLVIQDCPVKGKRYFAAYLCVAEKDKERIGKPFFELLTSWHFRIFLPEFLMASGNKYEDISNAITERCNEGKVIILLSKNYAESDECKFVTHYAHGLDPDSQKRKLIPVEMEERFNYDLPEVLKGVTTIKYHHDLKQKWLKRRIADAILA